MARLPLDKSWIKCCTMLDIIKNETHTYDFLKNYPQDELSDDVKACYDVLLSSDYNYFNVRNFRSLAVCLYYYLLGKGVSEPLDHLMMGEQLSKRKLLDENSSQLLSAKILLGQVNIYELEYDKLPFHSKFARNAVERYPKFIEYPDYTIKKQFDFYIKKLCGKNAFLKVESAEDVPLAVAFDQMTIDDAKIKFPQMANHETNRFKEMKTINYEVCASKDHRIIMAHAMKRMYDRKSLHIMNEECVGKSFPKFFNYLYEITNAYQRYS